MQRFFHDIVKIHERFQNQALANHFPVLSEKGIQQFAKSEFPNQEIQIHIVLVRGTVLNGPKFHGGDIQFIRQIDIFRIDKREQQQMRIRKKAELYAPYFHVKRVFLLEGLDNLFTAEPFGYFEI